MRGRDAENDAPEKPPGAEDGGQGHTTHTAWSRTPNVTVINFEAALYNCMLYGAPLAAQWMAVCLSWAF